MSLEAFIHQLHFDSDKASPLDFEVNWADRPLPYKLYRGLPTVPLSPEILLSLKGQQAPVKPDLHQIGSFLWYVCGLTQFSHTVLGFDFMDQALGAVQSARRFIPSGGGLYPNELYVYLKLEELPTGVYHYDVAHHRLVLLRSGNFDAYLSYALGHRCDTSACFGVAFVSTMFWKNFFKYHHFAYRLQGLDAGVVIGQFLEVAKRFGYESSVYFQFVDKETNHLLGLHQQEESVYAIMPLTLAPTIKWFAKEAPSKEMQAADKGCQGLPALSHEHYIRSKKVLEYPMLIRMNEASMIESTQQMRRTAARKPLFPEDHMVVLPQIARLSYDLVSACRKRYSIEKDFVLKKISKESLAALLHEATASFRYRNDGDEEQKRAEPRVFLYVCLYGADVPDGAYRYDSQAHALQPVRMGDHRFRLQQALSLDNVNLSQVPLCFHVVGYRDFCQTEWGYRGYRIQQMEAGMLVQRLLLAATALGMGGHPLLGFDVNRCDELYRLDELGLTSLIQIPVGPYRTRARLEGRLF